ncbi:Odorant receptor [Sergentomyia squamirostris]
MLKNHSHLKTLLTIFFKAWTFGFISKSKFQLLNILRQSIYPLYIIHGGSCVLWHLFVQIHDYTDILDVGFNLTDLIGLYQALMIYLGIVIYNKQRILEVFEFYEDLLEDEDVIMVKLRKRHFGRSIRIAYICAKYFLMATLAAFFLVVGYVLMKSDFRTIMFFDTPGISRSSIWFYPVNLMHQFFLFFTSFELIIISDVVIMITIVYCQAELSAIAELISLLNRRGNLSGTKPGMLVRKISEVHLNIWMQTKKITAAFYHIYFHKLMSIMLCMCTMFLICHSPDPDISVGLLGALVMILQALVLCYFGQLLADCSKKILDAIYMTMWYEMTVRDQKDLLMLMMRFRRPIKVEAFGFGDISIYTFVQICKAAVSYAAIIYTVLK